MSDEAIMDSIKLGEEHNLPIEDVAVEMAALSPFEYDQRRKGVANEYGVRVDTLDKEVARLREDDEVSGGGSEVVFPTPELLDREVSSYELIEALTTYINRYLILPEGANVVIALWVLHTYTHETARVSPILAITSPDMRCGKSTVLSVLSRLCSKPLLVSNISPAALFRTTEKYQPTLLIDEADTFLKDNEELRGVINSGHTRDTAFIIRTSGDDYDPRHFSTWAPKAIALIGALPATIGDRSIETPMRRKMEHEWVEKLPLKGTGDAEFITQLCTTWAHQNRMSLYDSKPILPKELNDRAQDNWTPLMSIAEQLGWESQATEAALLLSAGKGDGESIGTMLLSDLMDTFGSEDRMPTQGILEALEKLEDRPWGEWYRGNAMTARGLARQLEKYGIKPTTIRFGWGNAKGYKREDLQDAFNRYVLPLRGPDNPLHAVTPLQTSPDAGFNDSESVTNLAFDEDVTDNKRYTPEDVTDKNPLKPNAGADCNGVTDKTPENGGRERVEL